MYVYSEPLLTLQMPSHTRLNELITSATTVSVPAQAQASEVTPDQQATQDTQKELASWSDEKLVAKAQTGCQKSFSVLVERYQHKLGRLLMRSVRNAADVEDLMQEVFVKAFRALPKFRYESAFYTWLYRIGINTAKNHLTTRARYAEYTSHKSDLSYDLENHPQLQEYKTPEHLLHAKQIGKLLSQSIDSLPEDLRSAIVMREIEGFSYEEIALKMNCPIGTVRSRIFRAREAISTKLKPLFDT